jgi:hypothetical protein
MSTSDTKDQIAQLLSSLSEEVPALKQLQLVIRLELRGRGDTQVWRVGVPGPELAKDPAGDARVHVTVPRSNFNELVANGKLKDFVEAYEHGQIKVSGDEAVLSLVGKVIERQRSRSGVD